MNAFAKAIQAGLDHARQADIDLREVEQLILELSKAMQEATSGKIKVVLTKPGSDEPGRPLADTIQDAMEQHQALIFANRTYLLDIHRKSDGKTISLAELQFRPSVYPCNVTFDRQRTSCDGRHSLQQVLLQILASPTTGRAIYQLQE